MSDTETNPDQKKILQLYSALGASLMLSLVPSMIAALISMIMFCGVMIAAYVMRSDSEDGSLTDNHMTFLIRTIWIGSFFAMLSLSAGSAYLLLNHDNTPLDICVQHILNNVQSLQNMGAMTELLETCVANYWAANKGVIIISGVISAGPILIYFVMRYARGLSRALKGYRVSNPHGWF